MCPIPRHCGAIVAALFLTLSCGGAFAQAGAPDAGQAYPIKPIRLIVPFPAGASSDLVGRMLGQKLFEQLGQQVVADNRPGAGGNVGIAVGAKASPDGYTILISTPGIAISPALYSNLAYDAARDLTPIARLTSIHNIMLVHPSVPAKTLRQFISLARAHPGKLNFGSGGIGTTNHLANELLKRLEKINIVHVPYKGVTQAMVAMTGGEVDEVIMPVSTALPQIRAGKVRALAVLSDERLQVLPDVPTSKQAGVDDFTMPLWYGMFAPAGTPRDIVSRLSAEIVKALGTPDLRERLQATGVDPWPGTAGQMAELLRTETARYAEIVRSAGLPRE